MTWLVTGGAGYIGSHVLIAFAEAGTPTVVLDDLSSGFRDYVPDDVPFVEGSITDADAVAHVLDEYGVTGVVHLAGVKYAGQSVSQPLHFYRQNVTGMQVLMEAVMARQIRRFVLSSSASYYGTPDLELVDEQEPPRPQSPYGESKVISEWLLRDCAVVDPLLRHTSLRYFNVVGSGPEFRADHSPYNLFPMVFRALAAGETPRINGGDYATPDGTCVRDYIHVVDLAQAHVTAARNLESDGVCAPAYNVGRGAGSSVREVMDTIARVTGLDFTPIVQPRRPGDPARIVGSVAAIQRDLGWQASHDLDDMVSSAWAAWQQYLAEAPIS
ncbi:UDP-galactose 4-epimerase [Frankineae bacterium MT45]|nr:UDP-galactose 4-epimerase [Frankineae bacterium MT45]